jgi:hypothetical protein
MSGEGRFAYFLWVEGPSPSVRLDLTPEGKVRVIGPGSLAASFICAPNTLQFAPYTELYRPRASNRHLGEVSFALQAMS